MKLYLDDDDNDNVNNDNDNADDNANDGLWCSYYHKNGALYYLSGSRN